MFAKFLFQFVATFVAVGLLATTAQAVDIDTVTVGNPGNAGELSGSAAGDYGPDRICGAVDYVYEIGKYEVTAGQYTEFLNAVAASDPYGLYNPEMDGDREGCQITRNGSSGNYTYDFSGRPAGTPADWENRPVNYISWGDAARFANWVHNGQPTGLQGPTTTEDGSYYLNGAVSHAALSAVTREPGATWVIPSEDEWYKAAYHKNDGITGDYFDYPTSNNSAPSNSLVDPDPGNNVTIYLTGESTIGSPYHRTEVGAHENSESPYGTFDQGGNIMEWNEAVILTPIETLGRGLRGGSYEAYGWGGLRNLHAATRYRTHPHFEERVFGFRVALVPEPSTIILLLTGALGLLLYRIRRK